MSVNDWTIEQNRQLLLQLKQENKELKQVGTKELSRQDTVSRIAMHFSFMKMSLTLTSNLNVGSRQEDGSLFSGCRSEPCRQDCREAGEGCSRSEEEL